MKLNYGGKCMYLINVFARKSPYTHTHTHFGHTKRVFLYPKKIHLAHHHHCTVFPLFTIFPKASLCAVQTVSFHTNTHKHIHRARAWFLNRRRWFGSCSRARRHPYIQQAKGDDKLWRRYQIDRIICIYRGRQICIYICNICVQTWNATSRHTMCSTIYRVLIIDGPMVLVLSIPHHHRNHPGNQNR